MNREMPRKSKFQSKLVVRRFGQCFIPLEVHLLSKMGLGVLEDDHLEHIPGTALLRDVMENQTSVLRHEQGRNTGVILVPIFPIRNILLFISVWAYFAHFYKSLLASRSIELKHSYVLA